MTSRFRVAATTLAVAFLSAVLTTALPTATVSAQPSSTGPTAIESTNGQAFDPGTLPGANGDCVPSPRHPRPVVLVHGTGMSMQMAWGSAYDPRQPGPLVQALRADGYCVFALNYGYSPTIAGIAGPSDWGQGSMVVSARELARFVDTVRARTGAGQVDIVGHSQGGTLTRRYLRADGGADPANPANNKVHTVVMLGPTNHGTTLWGPNPLAALLAGAPIAAQQQTPGSAFLTDLNAGPETLPGIDYTVIASTNDRIVPAASSFLVPAPGTEGSVHQLTVQQACDDPNLAVSHTRHLPSDPDSSAGLLDHPVPLRLVRRALDPTLPATLPC